jgi:anti-sigma factor RsiW
MDKPDARKVWLEPVLSRHLGRVPAPQELWDRVSLGARQAPGTVLPKRSNRQMFVWAAAAAAVIVATLLVWQLRLRPEALAAQALRRGASQLEFRSEQAAAIRAWVKDRTGLDIPLLADPPASIRLVGASVADWGRTPTAEVVYRVGGRDAILLVSKADPKLSGNATHRFLSSGKYQGARVSTWLMHGQLCTLACPIPQNPQAGCLLCHATGAPRTLLN